MSSNPKLFQQFKAAQQFVQDQTFSGKIYGFSKQCTEGDCRMPCPPSSNGVLRAKWDAWSACQGISPEICMKEYITAVEQCYPSYNNSQDFNSAPTIINSLPVKEKEKENNIGQVIKQGILYKQRDVFKGWRPRKFVLQDTFLHYYLENDDTIPKKTMDINGCYLIEVKPNKVGDTEYFPFVISHPKSTKTYNLAALSKNESIDWMNKIKEQSLKTPSMSVAMNIVADRLLERRIRTVPLNDESTDDNETNKNGIEIVNPMNTLANIPKKYLSKVEAAVEAILQTFDPNNEDSWEVLYDKNGVTAKRKHGNVVTVKAESLILNQNVSNIFQLILNQEKAKEIDPQIHSTKIIKEFSSHTNIYYRKSKPVWPTAARDLCNISHWRLLADGRLIFVAYSEKFDDLCPLEENVIRAELILGGYILKPQSNGTLVQYVCQVDLKGSLPVQVINLVASQQPLVLANIKKILEITKPVVISNQKNKYATSYEDILEVQAFNAKIIPVDNLSIANIANNNSLQTTTQPTKVSDTTLASDTTIEAPSNKALNRMSVAMNSIVSKVVDQAVKFYYIMSLIGKAVVKTLPEVALDNNLSTTSLPNSRMIIKFPVDLGKLLRYLDSKREDSGVDITPTHMTIKAVATNRYESNSNNQNGNVDVSVSIDVLEKYTMLLKVIDVDMKPLEYIATELQSLYYGIAIPTLGIQPFSHGTCMILTSSNRDDKADRKIALAKEDEKVNVDKKKKK
eukprot:gene18913-24717_t